MEELSNRETLYAKYSEETNTIIKSLMMFYFQKNPVRFKLANISSFETKMIEENKKDVKIKTSKKWK